MNHFLQKSTEMTPQLRKDRRAIHAKAEFGMDLPETTAYVIRRLREIGLSPTEICKSGVTACIEGTRPGKTIMLRADMDALPMEERNDLPFKTTTPYAHLCGHDMHTAMLLGAATLLYEQKDKLKGTVKLMFQPGEEIFQGSAAMLSAGLLENPHVDAAMALHVSTDEEIGAIYYKGGAMSSSCDGFRVTVTGRGCHGAMPHLGIDPINIGVHIYLAMQNLIARETPPMEPALLTLGQFSGGNSHNIIPETVVLQGTLRTYNKELRAKLASRLREVVEQCAKTFNASAEYETLSDVPSIFTDPTLLKEMVEYIDLLGYPFRKNEEYVLTPSDDIARVSELAPTVFISVTAQTAGSALPLHNPGVILDEDVLPLGAAIFAQCASEWLERH